MSISLLEKIQRGDFELSNQFESAKYYKNRAEEIFEININNPLIRDYEQRLMEAEYSARSERLKARKYFEKGIEMEQKILKSLRDALENEFEVDLWDIAHEKQRGKGTTEDLYFWYKKQVGQTYTKSELQIRGII